MTEEKLFPTSLDASDEDVTLLTLTQVGELINLSRQSPRKRMLRKLHKSEDSAVHRMFNALQPGTYVAPHRHLDPSKDETVLVISGSMLFVEFTETGEIVRHVLLQPGTENFGVDVAPHIYHTYVPLKQDTLIFEVKTGPYSRTSDKDVPGWAPAEGSPEAESYLLAMLKKLAEEATSAAQAAQADEEGTEQ